MSEVQDLEEVVPVRPTERSHANKDKTVDQKVREILSLCLSLGDTEGIAAEHDTQLDHKYSKGTKVRAKDNSGTVTGVWKISSWRYNDSAKDWEYQIEDLTGIKHSSWFVESKLKSAK
ncbi:hypothetical protein MMC30_001529 [Trapelia coarctata]|nr:hypothetical protein [Trapelia coarctata]